MLEAGAQFRVTEEKELFQLCEEVEDRLEGLKSECEKKCKESGLLEKLESARKSSDSLSILARNIAIARIINEDLKEGETGVLLMGAAHKGIEKFISPSIQCEVIPGTLWVPPPSFPKELR